MLFSEPCCKVLEQCLQYGDERSFRRVGGDVGPLLVRTASSLYRDTRGQQRSFIEQAVIYCPFCGKHLQTPEDVERYMRGEES
jgi:hypothetical protein